eukprot:CAMPEP_0185204086 /NCGR_PEP_ID=MMETSP1140-20130426/54179_1 /TAXON_ID=298111 /ORGANISM="Pavlova sp., Strain CCMP459" /LENGTH=149 /DNA_ID=CAMNT_0027771617 /DNA_START=178 /DNA_END=626 /DNA_ORIENTATION=-
MACGTTTGTVVATLRRAGDAAIPLAGAAATVHAQSFFQQVLALRQVHDHKVARLVAPRRQREVPAYDVLEDHRAEEDAEKDAACHKHAQEPGGAYGARLPRLAGGKDAVPHGRAAVGIVETQLARRRPPVVAEDNKHTNKTDKGEKEYT